MHTEEERRHTDEVFESDLATRECLICGWDAPLDQWYPLVDPHGYGQKAGICDECLHKFDDYDYVPNKKRGFDDE